MTEWVRKRPGLSWHLLRLTRSLIPQVRCGHDMGSTPEVRSDLPAEKSCETCARLLIWDQERAEA